MEKLKTNQKSRHKIWPWLILVLIIVGLLLLLIPKQKKLQFDISSTGLPDGSSEFNYRAVDSSALWIEYDRGTVKGDIKDGSLKAFLDISTKLKGKNYTIELCSGSNNECYTNTSATKELWYSCPLYVPGAAPNWLFRIASLNKITVSNITACPQLSQDGKTFHKRSSISLIQGFNSANDNSGIKFSGNGILVAKDGQLTTRSIDELIGEQLNQADSNNGDVVNYYTTNSGSISNVINNNSITTVLNNQTAGIQSLVLSGRNLSITNGNTVLLPEDQNTTYGLSSSTTDGILSAADWNSFASKENSLNFDSSFVRSGDNISLMSCASGEVLKNDGMAWLCAQDLVGAGSATYSAGTGLSLSGTTFSNTGVLGVTSSGALTTNNTDPQNPAITLATSSDFNQVASQLNLSDTGVAEGTYNNVTVDEKGRVTAATNVSYLTSYTETDGVVGNEVTDVVNNGGLIMTGSGSASSPFKVGLVTTCSDGQLLKYTTAGGWACANDVDTDTDTDTDNQTLTWNTTSNVLGITGPAGSSVNLSALLDNTDSQAISKTGNTLSISGNAATVDLSAYLDNTDTQDLSLTTTAGTGGTVNTYKIDLVDGGFVTLVDTDTNTTYTDGNGLSLSGANNVFAIDAPDCDNSSDKLLWTGTTFTCSTDADTNTTYAAGSGLTLSGTTFALDQQGATSGQVLKWNGSAWTPATDTNTTYSAGTGITISGGSNTIAATLGTSIETSELSTPTNSNNTTAGDSGINVPNITVNDKGQVTSVSNRSLPTASNTTTGVLSSTDWNTFNGKENVLTFTGNGLFSRTGDTVTGATCSTSGQILKWDGTSFACNADDDTAETGITVTDSSTIDFTASGTANHTITAIVIDGSITEGKLSNDAVTTVKIKDGNVTSDKLADGSVITAKLANGNVTTAKLANDAVTSAKIEDGAVTESDLATDAVTTLKIKDGNVTTAKITNGAITTAKIASCSSNGQVLKYYATDPDAGGPLVVGWNCDADIDTNTDAVSSVFGRTGGVTAQSGDYNAGQVTNTGAGGISATTVQAAINELDSEKQATLTVTGRGLFSLSGATLSAATCANGELMKYNIATSLWECSADADTNTTYSAGTGITISGGSNTIAATLGTSIETSELSTPTNSNNTTAGDSGINVPNITVNDKGQVISFSNRALPTATTSTTGVLSSTDWNTFNGKENVLTFNGPLSRSGNTVSLAACTSNQIYQYNGSAWACTNQVTDTNTTYTAGSGLSLSSGSFSVNCGSSGTAFCQNGNSFGGLATLGTNDANGLAFETNSSEVMRITSGGNIGIGQTNPTVKFDVTASSLPHFQIDTTAKQVRVGSNTTDSNAISLVLDSYDTAADPTGVNGSMYYNSALGKFRCYEGGAWKDCITGPTTMSTTVIATSTSSAFADVPGLTTPVNSGKKYTFRCMMTYTTALATTAASFTINGPASTNINYSLKQDTTLTTTFSAVRTAFNTNPTSAVTGPLATSVQATLEGTFTTTAAGTFAVRYRTVTTGSAVNVLPDSFCAVQPAS